MKIKNILNLILIFVLILSFCACAKNIEQEEEASSTPIAEPEPVSEPEIPSIEVPEGYNMPYAIYVNRDSNFTAFYKQNSEGIYEIERVDLCSCGGEETTLGDFYISNQWEWATLIQSMYGQYTSRFNGDILFHSVPYSKKYDPSTLYGEEYNKLGTTASHGCVRLTVEAAKYLYDNCKEGTLVRVAEGLEEYPIEPTKVIKIDPACTWDPTDTNENNPWISNPEYMIYTE